MPGKAAKQHDQAEDNRGRLLALLCAADRTTSDVARELKISANGARWHLERLREEGLVESRTVRRGVGKPGHEHRLTEAGAARLSRAYLPVLSGLLAIVIERRGADEQEALLREAGRMLARERPKPDGELRSRVEAATALLGELGGISRAREEEGAVLIEGDCCPLRALVPNHPLACKAVEAMLEEYLGLSVREDCRKSDPPTCRLFIEGANG